LIAAIQTANISEPDNIPVAIETSLGTITAEFGRTNALISGENCLRHIENGHYADIFFPLCHQRVHSPWPEHGQHDAKANPRWNQE